MECTVGSLARDLAKGDNSIYELMMGEDFSLIVLILHRYNIRGKNIKKLYRDCCNSDKNLFVRTIKFFETVGTGEENKEKDTFLTKEEIIENLEDDFPISFLNSDDMPFNVPNLGEPFGNGHPNWKEYCQLQLTSYRQRRKDKKSKCA